MNTSVNKPAARRVWFDDLNLWVELTDGRQLAVPLAYFPRLQRATPRQRLRFSMSGGGTGLHWDALDEDISVAGLLAGRGDQTRSAKTLRKAEPNGAPVRRRSPRKSSRSTKRTTAASRSSSRKLAV